MPDENRAQHTGAGAFNIVIVIQHGRLQYEALLFAASLRRNAPRFSGRLLLAEPQPGPLWPDDPRVRNRDLRDALHALGAEFVPFHNKVFGAAYPQGNKIEMLCALPPGTPFVFFDTDTLILSEPEAVPFDFNRPGASLRREGTWPRPTLYGPGAGAIWRALYDRFGLDFDSSLDPGQAQDTWRRYLYFNAGAFWHRCPATFGTRFLQYASAIRDDPPPELAGQRLDPWLDQIALPLVIHSLGGGRDALPSGWIDGRTSCHYRMMPLLYARENPAVIEALERCAAPNRIKKRLKPHAPFRRMIYQGKGRAVRALFDQADMPAREQAIRARIRRAGLWMR